MSLKNGNTVAVERRMDLASFFCMIGRHGPAVAVAVIVMVSVLAGFIIYRTLERKRRKATAAAAESDGQTPGAEGDASVIQPSPEESHSSVMATGLSYEGSLDVKEDFDLIQSDHKIRHRSAAAAAAAAAAVSPAGKEPSPYFSHMKDIQVPEDKHHSSDDTVEMAVMRDSYRVAETYPEVASQSLQSDTYTDAEMVVEEADDCYYSATNDIIEDVIEEVHDMSSCLTEPDVIYEENHKDEQKVLEAECQEAEVVTTYKDASDGKTRQDEEIDHTSENDESPLTCSQTETNSVGSNLEDSVVDMEDAPVPCVCNVKDEEFEEENTESVACSNISIHHLSTEEEKKSECEEAEEECEDYQLIPQQAVIHSSTFEEEANLPSTKQDHHAMDEGILPIQDSEKVTDEDHMNDLTAVDMHTALCNETEVEIEQKEGNGSTCSQEVGVLHDKEDQVEEEKLASDESVARAEECESLSVETSPALACLSVPTSAENIDDCVSDIITDVKAQISGISDSPDFSSDSKQTLKEDEIDPSLTEDTDSTILGSQMPSHDTGNEAENNEKDPTVLSAEKCTDRVYEPDVQSCFRDQQSDEMIHSVACDGENIASPLMAEDIPLPHVSSCNSEQQIVEIMNNEVFGKGSVADGDTVEKVTSSETLEETFPYMPSICQDQESDHIEDHNSDLTRVTSESDTPACDHACHTALLIEEEISTPDMLSSFQYQQSDHMENTEDFDETGVDTPSCKDASLSALSMAEEISFPGVLPPSQDQQSDQNGNCETFDEIGVTAAFDTPACNDASLTEPLMPEEKSHPDVMPSSLDQLGDNMENTESHDTLRDNSASDVLAFDQAGIKSTITSEEISHTDMMSSFQDILSNQVENYEHFPEGITLAPVMTANSSPPLCPIYFPSFKQSELGDNDLSSPGIGKESGISSMAVSPDLQDAGNVFDVTVENIVVPVMDYDRPSAAEIESKYSLFSDDVAVSYKNENTAGMIFGPFPSQPQPPHSEQMDWRNYESFAANEDMFGLEIEDSYHREMDQFTAQIVDSVTSLADELKEETDIKAVVEVAEIKEKKAQVGVGKKEDTKAEEEEAMDLDKTGISIMEATMDNNEWITDSNYQVLPWMNLSAPSISQDHTKQNQLSTEESSAESDVSFIVTTDEPPATEVKQTSDLSLVDENSENSKKVQAVQPMPQNVNVTFRVHYCTQSPYQTVAVTGDQQELGNWKGFIPLERAKDGHWATVVSLPTECHVQWKFVLLNKGEVCRWEECGNRFLETGSGDDLLVHKWWGLL